MKMPLTISSELLHILPTVYTVTMAKVSYVSIPVGLESAYERVLQPGDRFTLSRVRIKRLFLSRAKIKHITQKSLMVSLAPAWKSFTLAQRTAWTDAGAVSDYSGWRLFLQDTAYRRKAGLSGYAVPNLIYQTKVGRIDIVAPATGMKIEQPHPSSYYVRHKVPRTRSQYEPKKISEPFSLPLTISIACHTNLVSVGAGTFARLFCNVVSSYQSRDIVTPLVIPFGLTDVWQNFSATLSSVVGIPRYYEAFIDVYNATGNLYFDNVKFVHDGQNWARDPRCLNVKESFTKVFYQVPRHWAVLNPTTGAELASFYYVS